MPDLLDRESVAYAIIGVVAFVAMLFLARRVSHHRRLKLRRRGIKRYGH